MKDKIAALADKYYPRVLELRRHLHANPELSWNENNTAVLVAEELHKLGFEVQTGVAKTGVIGLLKTNNPNSKCIALRADMDALPINEQSDKPYCSTKPGIMHACGHDVHTSNLLGAAMILAELKGELQGTYKFIFQPSEEKIPSGADAMVKEGVLTNPKVDKIFGLHVTPELEAGKVGFCVGRFMASSDEIYLTVHGKGGHAAQPQKLVNPLLIASQILLATQHITNLDTPIVLSFGKIEGKGATNIVPNTVEIAGTLRCFDEELRAKMHEDITALIQDTAAQHGGTCEVNILKGYPVLVNDISTTESAISSAQQYMPADKVIDMPIRMGSEDFAYYTHHVPACFCRLGTGNEAKGTTAGLHTPSFDIDEDVLRQSTGLLAWLAVNA